MSNALLSRVKGGAGAQGFSQAVQIFIRLAEVPLLLAFWGAQLYGEWLILAAIPSYLAMCDGGFAGAATREMAIRSGAGDKSGALAIFRSAISLILTVSIVAFGLMLMIVQFLPLTQWFGFVVLSSGEVQVILLLLVTHLLLGFFSWLLYGGFWCGESYPIGMTLRASSYLLEFLGIALAAITGGGPIEAAIGSLVGRIIGIFALWFFLRTRVPWLKCGTKGVSIKEIRLLARPAFTSLALPVGDALNIQGARIVVGLVLGPAAVAAFSSIRTLTRLVLQPAVMVSSIIQPEMSLAHGRKDFDMIAKLFVRSSQVSLWLSMTGAVVLFCLSRWLVPLWTSGALTIQWMPLAILVLAAVFNSVWATALAVPYSTNRYGRLAIIYCSIYGVLTFAFVHLGALYFGINGAIVVLMLADLAMLALVLPSSLGLSRISISEWISSIIIPPYWLLQRFRNEGQESQGRS